MADDFAVDVVVIGAGVVGLAIAERLSAAGRAVFVLEKNDSFGQETSSRNSEVIHAGLQYTPGSLKARLCVRGNRMVYDLCQRHNLPYRNTSKLVIAVEEDEVGGLEALKANAERNGAAGLRMIGRAEIAAMEPHVRAPAALFVPPSGIVDAHSLMTHFAQSAGAHGAELVYRTAVRAIEPLGDGYHVSGMDAAGDQFALRASAVVNAAGLWADAIAALAGIDIDAAGYRQHFCKGDYFSVAPARTGLVSRLVYPLAATGAERAGTRIHLTLDLAGRLRLGPDAVWLPDRWRDDPHYRVDASRQEVFWQSARRYLPWLEPTDLAPEGAGVRPRAVGPGDPQRDYIIQHEADRGLPGFINLIGIESPGLTASPAIAEYVAGLLG
ncbi:MAG TPA: NAD(P)/FAD-dependent oxidoreductase [Ktedonobacterales bacterium]|nr:NAD(P)/FAD-dependent oxidoreductase [Ktedonobacterales bacterium]